MKPEKLKSIIESLVSCVGFDYNNKSCGVDPFNAADFDMWYGENDFKAHSIEEVMSVPLFNGKSLEEISEAITDIDY